MIQKVPFTIPQGASVSQILDLGADGQYIVAISIHGQWTAGKIGFQAYVPGSATIKDDASFAPAVAGGAGVWVGGPYDSTAAFDTIKDSAGGAIQYGNGTDTGSQYLVIATASLWHGVRYIKVTGPVQQQAVTGYLLVDKPF